VVQDEEGLLFDITPLEDERQRPQMRFVTHVGDADAFGSFEQADRFICCADCSPFGDEASDFDDRSLKIPG
jgi:hypothetical protein